ncbi:MAG: serine hydrolase domain-containing protein [Ktedonobacteraceae bacterium]
MRARHVHLNRCFVFAMSLFVCLVVSACSSAVAPATQATPTVGVPAFAEKLQPLLVAKMKEQRTPGAIIFVDDPGQGSWTTTLGTSDLATRMPMDVNSYMRIGSITKTLTGTVVLQLVDEGKLRLDDPVGKYQPEVPNGGNITIRELLNMTSGLFNYSEDQGFDQALLADPGKVWNPKDLVAIAFQHPPYFAPGQGLHYTNTNYILLGMLIEQITGMPVEKAFQQHIFTPLRMDGSSLPPRTSAAIPDPHPHGYMYGTEGTGTGPTIDVTGWNTSWGWTAGSAISTLHDLKIWAKALATGQLLSASTQKERLSWVPYKKVSWIGHDTLAYGLGMADFGGFIGHNGGLPGFQSFMVYQPQKGATIVVLTNLQTATDGSGTADELEKVIQKELFA